MENGINKNNGQTDEQPGPSTEKRMKLAESAISDFENEFGSRPVAAVATDSEDESGPKYPVVEDSFILKQKFLVQNPSMEWSTSNTRGIVPVVVHPLLVQGKNGQKLSNDQIEGIQFLWNRYELQSGGILAHDMGLGKTRTGVSFIATLLQQSSMSHGRSSSGIKKCLIIAPKNAVDVWVVEFGKWVPDDICRVVKVSSSQGNDGWKIVNDFRNDLDYYNVMVLSYEAFQKYSTGYADGFAKYPKDTVGLVFCDEAHRLKNPATMIVKTLKSFIGGKLWIGITGTPYQNNLEELCSLVQFFCHSLRGCNFKNDYCKPINDSLRKYKKLFQEQRNLLATLRNRLRPALHYKKNTFLMERHDVVLCIPLDGHPTYRRPTARNIQHILYQLITECLAGSDISSFESLSYLHKACIHPTVVYDAMKKHPIVFGKPIQHYDSNFLSEEDVKTNPTLGRILPMYSAKIRVLTKMALRLRKTFPKEKMVIISSSTVLLDQIKKMFTQAHGMEVLVYDGEKSEAQRSNALKTFDENDEIQFLLLSLKAGGTALTLTRANHLVMLDPDYNPANDRQGIARIYRPGQNRKVYIYRFLATGTLEEVKFIRQLEKENLDQSIKAEDEDATTNVQAPYDETDMRSYFANTKSYVMDKLDTLDIDNFNSGNEGEITFAQELKKSNKYRESYEVPEELDLVKGVWDSVSFAFHTHKVPDQAEQLVLEDLDEPFEFVAGDINFVYQF